MDLYGKKNLSFLLPTKMKGFQEKEQLTLLKTCVTSLRVVHGPIYDRFMGFYVNGFLSIYPSGRVAGVPNLGKPYGEKAVYIKPIKQP